MYKQLLEHRLQRCRPTIAYWYPDRRSRHFYYYYYYYFTRKNVRKKYVRRAGFFSFRQHTWALLESKWV